MISKQAFLEAGFVKEVCPQTFEIDSQTLNEFLSLKKIFFHAYLLGKMKRTVNLVAMKGKVLKRLLVNVVLNHILIPLAEN